MAREAAEHVQGSKAGPDRPMGPLTGPEGVRGRRTAGSGASMVLSASEVPGPRRQDLPAKRAKSRRTAKATAAPRLAYKTRLGRAYYSTLEGFLDSRVASSYAGRIDLILTSPPFPLNRKKAYGNFQGDRYLEWLKELAPRLVDILKPNGSLVIELGNAWEPGEPVMSTLTTRALLAFLEAGELKLCEEFIGYNKARLPSPAQWVTVERIRVKDAYTHIWWMSPVARPPASNRRVLRPYSPAMRELLRTGKYNSGPRPGEAVIGKTSFNHRHGGSIPPNVLEFANTSATDAYLVYCKKKHIEPHPARMNAEIARFFIQFLTQPGGLVFDPFAGSNTTGATAQTLKRRWVSLERDAGYLRGSRGRFL
jgi:DNA modification methylase